MEGDEFDVEGGIPSKSIRDIGPVLGDSFDNLGKTWKRFPSILNAYSCAGS